MPRWTLSIGVLLALIPSLTGWAAELRIDTQGNHMTLVADGVPLRTILARLAGEERMTVYLAEEVQDRPVTVTLEDLTMEKIVAKLLRDYSYLVSLKEENGQQRITMLKVYPKGTFSGHLQKLEPAVAAIPAAGEPKIANPPSRTTSQVSAPTPITDLTPPPPAPADATGEDREDEVLAAMRRDFAREQQELFREQLAIERRLAAATDPAEREALAMALAAQVEKLKQLKTAQTNKLESFKRLRSLAEASQDSR